MRKWEERLASDCNDKSSNVPRISTINLEFFFARNWSLFFNKHYVFIHNESQIIIVLFVVLCFVII